MKTKPYKCTDCQEITLLKDNGEITVGYCSRCGHPLWNPSEEQTEKHMKIPYEVKHKLHNILSKRLLSNKNYPNGCGLQCGDFNETTSDITEYLAEFLRDELIKYEAHQRIDRATHHKEFEFAEQAVDNYLDPPGKKIDTVKWLEHLNTDLSYDTYPEDENEVKITPVIPNDPKYIEYIKQVKITFMEYLHEKNKLNIPT